MKWLNQTNRPICHYVKEDISRKQDTACTSRDAKDPLYDNARMESFFATLKKEKLYQISTYRMKREEVKTVIFRYIFGYYNTQRINSFNADGLPPVALRTSTG